MSLAHPDEPPPAAPAETPLEAEIARVRASDALGQSGRLRDLFDYLLRRSADEASPKEAEIALEVFGKADTDAGRDDPVARVYIHRLRKRLDDFYLRYGAPLGVRLDIPRGEYRILAAATASPAPTSTTADPADPYPAPKPRSSRLVAGLVGLAALLVIGNIAAWAWLMHPDTGAETDVRRTSIWTGLAQSDRPLLIVIGDYYIFGEYEDQVVLKRLVRDFAINSKDDLLQRYASDPHALDKYSDVALHYLPTSAGFALADIAPLMQGRQPEVMLASDLTPDRLKTNDIIYVGLISGMGPLKDAAFAHSRFSIGESYDQIIDHKAGVTYTSEAFLAAPSDTMYRDYGFFSAFRGPSGNRIAILAGARDTALMGVAEAMTRRRSIEMLTAAAGRAEDIEAVFEVKGQKNVNLESRPIATAKLDSGLIWSGAKPNQISFPSE